ncbi:MAG: FprA family A-type flavoprotein [Chloroflexi bacterium]|nr:FprA family A-type flavoprotein [Chloroflexota bacterium]
MKPREMRPGVYWVGAIDWERRLFDSMIPLPDGTSYNAYLVRGSEKTVLIDTVDPAMSAILAEHLDHLKVNGIDYVIANHAEQDHSGTLPYILSRFPQAKVLVTPRGKDMLYELLMVPPDRMVTVNDRDTVSLGDRTLEFIHAPWVHWPETMLTYLREERILFTCDFFGSHIATSDLYAKDERLAYEEAKRYYAEIMMPFHVNIQRHLERLKEYTIDMIAPSHGPVYDRPAFVIEAYRSWVVDPPKNIVVLPYVTMHGSTRSIVERLASALVDRGVTVKQFDLTVTDIGKLAMALVEAATLVIATPMVQAGLHPQAAFAIFLTNIIRPKLKYVSLVGSYSWGGKMDEQMKAMLSAVKVEFLPPVICKGLPKEADLMALDALADTIAQKHKENGFT